MPPSSPFPFLRPVDQLGYVVADLDAEIAGWLAQGVGPWLRLERARIDDYRYRGRSSKPMLDVAFCQVGDVQLELIRPIDGQPTIYRDFLAAGRRGIQHIGWMVEDYSQTLAAVEAAHQSILQSGAWSTVHFTYVELAPPIDVLSQRLAFGNAGLKRIDAVKRSIATFDGAVGEIIELNGTSSATFAAIKRAAMEWDGRFDPIRPLLSPALRALLQVQSGLSQFARKLQGDRGSK